MISSSFAICVWAAVVTQAPADTGNDAARFTDAWFEGTVGYAPVRAYVGGAGWPKSDGMWGIYYYTKYQRVELHPRRRRVRSSWTRRAAL